MSTTTMERIVIGLPGNAPRITDVQLTIERDPNPAVTQFDIQLGYTIVWDPFSQATNLAFSERWELVGVDGTTTTTLWTGPLSIAGLRSNGNASTDRTQHATVSATVLDEDPSAQDEIAAVITLTPLLPYPTSGQSNTVSVSA